MIMSDHSAIRLTAPPDDESPGPDMTVNGTVSRTHARPSTTRDSAQERARVTAMLAETLDDPPGVLLTGSCTHALEAAALLCGVGPGDEVIVPAFTFPSTANAFLLRGATVRFADVRADDGNIDPLSVERRVTARTKVIVPVHYGGVPADLGSLQSLADATGAVLIEDAAQGVFARAGDTPLGRIGTFGCLSFHRTKNVTAGEGGALVINDPDLVTAANDTIDKGTNRSDFVAGLVAEYDWTCVGSSWRLPDAGVLRLGRSLDRAESIQSRRHHVWARYQRELRPWADANDVALPGIRPDSAHPAHLFWIGLPDPSARPRVVQHCADRGVEVARHFSSLPESPFGSQISWPQDRCPVASVFARRLLRLPLHHRLDDSDVDRVLAAVTTAVL